MKYDFTSIIDRKGKDALAIDALGMVMPRMHQKMDLMLFPCGLRI